MIPATGGTPTELFDVPPDVIAWNADWSPDGSKVVFEWYEQGWDHNELRAANLDGSGMQTLWVGGPTQTAELPDWGQ